MFTATSTSCKLWPTLPEVTQPLYLFLDRTLLRARSPPFCPLNHPQHFHVENLKSIGHHTGVYPPFISTILKLSKDQIDYLKCRPRCCGSYSDTISTFQSVSAHIWKCLCLSRGLAHDKESQLLFPVAIRSRILPLPKHFFSNTVTCHLKFETMDRYFIAKASMTHIWIIPWLMSPQMHWCFIAKESITHQCFY